MLDERWVIVGAIFSIFFSVLADGLASVPTVVKSWKFPSTESSTIFLFSGVNATITLLTIETWNFQHWAFPVYILAIDVLLYILIRSKLGERLHVTMFRNMVT